MVDAANKTVHLDDTFSAFCEHSGIPVNGRREQVTQMLENLGGTVIQVTNWFENENGKTVHDAINILVADHTHICFDRNSKEYLKGSYIRFSEPMWNILNENPVPLSRGKRSIWATPQEPWTYTSGLHGEPTTLVSR